MGFAENLDALMVMNDINAAAIARAADVSEATVSAWRRGAQPRKNNLEKLVEYYCVSLDDLTSSEFGLAAKEHGFVSHKDGYVDAPIYGTIAAGTPLEMIEDSDTFPVPERIAAAHPKGGFLRVRGNSFDRTLPDGCLAYIDFDMCEPNEFDAFAVCVNGYAATIKRIRVQPNGVQLVPNSNDPSYQPMTYDYTAHGTDEVTIIGKVVWATMPFDYKI